MANKEKILISTYLFTLHLFLKKFSDVLLSKKSQFPRFSHFLPINIDDFFKKYIDIIDFGSKLLSLRIVICDPAYIYIAL